MDRLNSTYHSKPPLQFFDIHIYIQNYLPSVEVLPNKGIFWHRLKLLLQKHDPVTLLHTSDVVPDNEHGHAEGKEMATN